MENRLDLTRDEFSKIIESEIGHGTDGVVFKYNKDYLIKLYRTNFFKEPSEIVKNAEMKIYDPNNKPKFVPIKENIRFYISEENDKMKLSDEATIDRIVEKQKRVTKTELPKKLVYVDGKLVGVLLKKVKGIQVHKFMGAPFAYKKKVALAIIEAVKELLENNIYHIDMSNSPYADTSYHKGDDLVKSHGHSHVLLNPFTMKVNIIDLDGKSAIYTDYIDKVYEEQAITDLSILIIEFLYGLDEKEYALDESTYIEENPILREALIERGIDMDTADKIAKYGFESMEEIEDTVRRSK